MSALPAPLFEIRLGSDQIRLAPKSIDELVSWTERECGPWEKVLTVPNPQDTSFLAGVQAVLKNLSRAKQNSATAKGQTGADQLKSIDTARSQIEDVFNSNRMPLSDSVRGKLLLEIAAQDPYVAKVALYVAGVGGSPNIPVQIVVPATARGIVHGALVHSLAGPVAEAAIPKLAEKTERDLARWNASHDQAVERVDKTHREIEMELAKFKAQAAEAAQMGNALDKQLRESFATELKAAKDELQRFQQATSKEIALKAPTEYWRNKATKHWRNSWLLVVALFVLIGAFAAYAMRLFPALFTQTGKDLPSYGYIAAVVIVATLAFWTLRILVRLFFSQIHLGQDAQERVTMVTTYLALLETGKFAAGDLAVVLNALFRTAADGIVKDEGMPLSVFELLTRQNKP
jgi:hypothetical protein